LTREEAAVKLGVHPRTIDRWARRGRLHLIDFGGTVRMPADEASRLQHIQPWTRFD
jgi:excisionase family DNA binding protein